MATSKKPGRSSATKPAAAAKKAGPVNLIVGAAAIGVLIGAIAKAGKKLDLDIQRAALSTLNHASEHGDVTLINKLYLCMPQGSRKRALAEYLMAFGNVLANTNRSEAREAPFVYTKDKKFDVTLAAATMWYDFAPEPEVADMFDVRAALHSVIQRAKKASEQGTKISDLDLYARLQQIDDAFGPIPTTQTQSQGAASPATAH